MKRVSWVSAVFGLMTFGLASQAEAIVTLQIIGCQGATCVASPVVVVSGTFGPVIVGDFLISGGSGSTSEGVLQSQVAQTTINVSRTGVASANPLDVYVVASNYNQPNPPGALFSDVAVTYINQGGATGQPATPEAVTFEGRFVNGNVPLPVALPFAIPPNTSAGVLACTPTGNNFGGSCSVTGAVVPLPGTSTVPFSLITQTRFNIGTAANNLNDTYGTTAQISVFPPLPQQTPVPEPASMVLLGTGLLGLVRAARRRIG